MRKSKLFGEESVATGHGLNIDRERTTDDFEALLKILSSHTTVRRSCLSANGTEAKRIITLVLSETSCDCNGVFTNSTEEIGRKL